MASHTQRTRRQTNATMISRGQRTRRQTNASMISRGYYCVVLFVLLGALLLDSAVMAFVPPSRQMMTVSTTTSLLTKAPPSTTSATTTSVNLFGFKKWGRVKEGEKQETSMEEAAVDESAIQTEKGTTISSINAVDNVENQMANMMKPIREAGPAGALSLFLWEGAFWLISIPVCSVLYYQATGAWPDWSQKDDVAKVTAEAVAFANIARFALPVRVGLAVATTPWVKENIVDRFGLFQSNNGEVAERESN
jgi:hypothetical protein